MRYPISFRRKVIAQIEEGVGKREAARLFKISPDTLHRWLRSDDLSPKVHGLRHRKLCKKALRAHVERYPDALLRDRSVHFGVDPSAIWRALKAMKIGKKTTPICRALYYEKAGLLTRAALFDQRLRV